MTHMARRQEDKCSPLYAHDFCSIRLEGKICSLVADSLSILKFSKCKNNICMHATANITARINYYVVTYDVSELMYRSQSE